MCSGDFDALMCIFMTILLFVVSMSVCLKCHVLCASIASWIRINILISARSRPIASDTLSRDFLPWNFRCARANERSLICGCRKDQQGRSRSRLRKIFYATPTLLYSNYCLNSERINPAHTKICSYLPKSNTSSLYILWQNVDTFYFICMFLDLLKENWNKL